MKVFNFLLPKPASVVPETGVFRITIDFSIEIKGEGSNRVNEGAQRFRKRLAEKTGLFFETGSPGESLLTLEYESAAELTLGANESYLINVSAAGVVIRASTDLGILRGLETLLQLVSADREGYYFPAVQIDDEPRFPWRGLMIDCARHFQPLDVLKRNLDGMASVKLNVFHWHLTDDQGFRVESKVFPRLHELGSNGEYYTQEQIREIVEYADQRGIRVIPEFDLPGHVTSWVIGHPELSSAPGPYTREIGFGVFDPVFDPIQEHVYAFLKEFFSEMIELFPDEYMHIGGDENNGKHWLENSDIVSFMDEHGYESPLALQCYFTARTMKILAELGKKSIGWDEILTDDLPTTAVVQSWRGRESLVQGAKRGHKIILSNGYYIDLCQPAEFHYLNDPLPVDLDVTEEEAKNILGGEATMWSELVSPETIDSRIWPRTAAIAERLWSRREDCSVEKLHDRLDVISLALENLGLTHEKNYPQMLRRLSGGLNITPVKNLLDFCKPVQGYERVVQRKYTVLSPLTRAVDAVRPDPRGARKFADLVAMYQGESEIRALLERQLNIWVSNHAALVEIIKQSPILDEMITLSEDLTSIAAIALGVLNQPSKKLDEDEKTALAEAKKPRGQLQLAVISAIEELIGKSSN